MHKNLNRFYRLTLVLILCNVLIKTVIWTSASLKNIYKGKMLSPIVIFKSTPRVRFRYTTKQKQKVFKTVDYLLPPAFSMLFILIVVKLVKTPEIFKEKD